MSPRTASPDGRLKYGLRRPWRDGTTAVLMEPLEFMERLAALVPAPRRHQLRYHGTLAPHAKWRPLIVPATQPATQPATGEAGCGLEAPEGRRVSSRLAWAELLKRVFASDALACPKCGGRMKVIATISDPEVVRKVLTSLGLPTRGPPRAPARERPQRELEFEV